MESVEPEKHPPESVQFETGECSKAVFNAEEDASLVNIASAEEFLDQKVLLDYERQMFLDLVHSDGLVISAKGIPYDRVLVNFLKVHTDPGNLILVLNSSEWEENYYKPQLDQKYVHEVGTTANERERVYLEGGIQFISTRILVVDLLKKRLPIELITGIVVLRAHTIVESCQEAFAIRLFRQINKTGFIKAFSSSPEAFTIGYSQVERTMRNIFVKELFIWPRFHATIKASLKPYEAQTVELHVPMTQNMIDIQTEILDIMNYLVKELKRINRSIDLAEITVENCVTKKFHKILQAQLDCIWHQLNSQTKLIVSDLKVLRNLMISTMYSDSVNAYALMKRYRTTEYALRNSGWILLDSAEQLFKSAKSRVFNKEEEFSPELCPKWRVLSELLRVEIPNDVKRQVEKTNDIVKVLILCQDSRTCHQLNQYLTQGGERYLLYAAMKNEIPINKLAESYKKVQDAQKLSFGNAEIAKKSLFHKINSTTEKKLTATVHISDEESEIFFGKADETRSAGPDDELSQVLTRNDFEDTEVFRESYILTMSQRVDNVSFVAGNECENDFDVTVMENADFEPFPELENLDVTSIVTAKKQPLVCIQTFKTDREGAMALDRILNEINPQYVIMYHCNVTAIRQLEVFEARKNRPSLERLKVFFLMHAGTVEEQSYLTSLRREKQAFELLIETKKNMVVPEYQDGRTDEAFILLRGHEDDEKEGSTRQAGGQTTAVIIPKIIVDMREFRSDLPCLIHRRGIEVLPVTIAIGDYILTPEICVERKSISDLIGSLNSGRLYNQCIQMQRYYPKPILLIEFDQNKPFHLQGRYMLSGESGPSNSDIVQKLQLLTIHFPKLRLIWSPSPYATAQLFEELKQGKDQPDATKAANLGTDESNPNEIDNFNTNIFDFMIRLPGINSKNISKVMRHGSSLKELLKKTEVELAELLDSQANARMLWDILHGGHLPAAAEPNDKPFASKFRRGRGRGGRKF